MHKQNRKCISKEISSSWMFIEPNEPIRWDLLLECEMLLIQSINLSFESAHAPSIFLIEFVQRSAIADAWIKMELDRLMDTCQNENTHSSFASTADIVRVIVCWRVLDRDIFVNCRRLRYTCVWALHRYQRKSVCTNIDFKFDNHIQSRAVKSIL